MTFSESPPASRRAQLWTWCKTHSRSIHVLAVLLSVVFLVDLATFSAGFGSNDDPGTYTDQAWALLNWGKLAHYTYWYDHPPLGWVQIALYAFVTGGFHHSAVSSLMASQFMVIAQLVACALIFVFMRRLKFNRGFAALAVALFALNPLAINFQKMAFLDNIAVTWTLAAMVFAVSQRRSLASAMGAGMCLAIATLSKETAGIWLPVVVYLLWQNHGKGNRSWPLSLFGLIYANLCMFYVLYAVIKGELVPGKGHVSLLGSFVWQLTRAQAGSDTLHGWLQVDNLLLGAAVLALPIAVMVRRLRPVALGGIILGVLVLRGGYIPAPFVIGMLPFAALLVAGALGSIWPYRARVAVHRRKLLMGLRLAVVAIVAAAGIAAASPSWAGKAEQATSNAEVVYYQQTVNWVEHDVPKNAVIAVDDNMWLDLHKAGYTNVVWFYKLDLDPAIKAKYVPHGYKGIDYIVLKNMYVYIARDDTGNSVVSAGVKHGQLVCQFGNPGTYSPTDISNLYSVYRVKQEAA